MSDNELMSNIDLTQKIERVKRITRNQDILDLIEELEIRMSVHGVAIQCPACGSWKTTMVCLACRQATVRASAAELKRRFDKKACQRDYMRRRRARQLVRTRSAS